MMLPILAALLLSAVPGVRAETIHLKDGGRIEGVIRGADAESMSVETPDGVLSIRKDRIARVEYSKPGDEPAPASAPVPNSAPVRNSAPVPNSAPAPTSEPTPAPAAAPSAPAERRPAEPGDPRPATDPPPGGFSYDPDWRELRRGTQFFTLTLGGANPRGELDLTRIGGGKDVNGRSGGLIGLQYLWQAGPHVGVGGLFEATSRTERDSRSLLNGAATTAEGGTAAFLAVVRWTLVPRGAFQPFLLGGIGFHGTSLKLRATPLPGLVWTNTGTRETRTLVDDSSRGGALTLRVGADLHAARPLFAGFEAGLTSLSGIRWETAAEGRRLGLSSIEGSMSYASFAIRLGARFGR